MAAAASARIRRSAIVLHRQETGDELSQPQVPKEIPKFNFPSKFMAAAASARIGRSAIVLHHHETGDDRSSDALPRMLTLKRKALPVHDTLCERRHAHVSYGIRLWEIFSIEVRRNMEYCTESEVRIYGEIRLHYDGRFADYLFKRSKEDAQVFKNPGKELSLTLQGPVDPHMLLGNLGEFAVYAILKYNDESIFYDGNGRFTCVEEAFINRQREDVGYGLHCSLRAPELSSMDEQITVTNQPFHILPILNKVASLNLKLGGIANGMVASLKFTVSRDVALLGEITARACNLDDCSIVLFKTEKEVAVQVKSNGSIPLSRSIAAVHSHSSLVIQVQLYDAINRQPYYSSIHLEEDDYDSKLIKDGDTTQSSSKRSMFHGLIHLEVTWTLPSLSSKYLIEMGILDSDSELDLDSEMTCEG